MPDPFDAADHAARIAEQGYTIVEGAIEPELCRALRDDVRRLERELGTKPARNSFEGRQTLRVYNLLVHGELYQRVPVHQKVLPIVERVLDAGCLVSSLSSIDILPGEVPQPLHADDQLIPLPKPHPALVCNSMWALTDFTEQNGATRVVAGSHLFDGSPEYGSDRDDARPALMPAGSVMVYHGSLWHGGGANRSAAPRLGIAMNYCAGWVRQQENQQRGIPRGIARGFSSRLRELVGYSVYNGVIGHIDRKHPGLSLDDPGALGLADD